MYCQKLSESTDAYYFYDKKMHAETVYFSCIMHLQKYFCPFLFLDLLLNSSQSTCFKREKMHYLAILLTRNTPGMLLKFLCPQIFNQCRVAITITIIMVAHNCHSKTKNLTVNPKTSWQKQNTSRQKQNQLWFCGGYLLLP